MIAALLTWRDGRWELWRRHWLSHQVAPRLETRQLKVVLERFELPPRPISIVYPHARLIPARTRAFIDWVRNDITAFRG